MIGQTISHYQVIEKLGVGGMGVVYKAEDRRLCRYVALKFLPEEVARDPHALSRFRREARAASALNHPNICTIHDVGETNGYAFIVMEFLEGQTFRERLRNGPFRYDEYADLAVQMAGALEAAHAKGVIHRDIKPENVFLTTKNKAKLLDFGLAKVAENSLKFSETISADSQTAYGFVTAPGSVMGTLSYMSPEQARGEELDERTDLFSLGAVLYEMATGLQAFLGNTPAMVYDAILNRSLTPPRRVNSAVLAGTELVILKALEKNRSERYQSAKDLLADLQKGKDLETIRLRVPAKVSVRRQRVGKAITSIAVLPFANSGDSPESEYLGDGIADSILSSLSRLPRLRVTARSTAFRYRARVLDPQAVGRELNVQAVVMGRILERFDTLKVDAELVDVANGWRLWAEEYNRQATEILTVQDEIARSISENLRRELTQEERKRLKKRYTDDPEAYHLYLKGLHHWNKRSEEGIQKGIEYYRQAIDADPTYALAYAGLADCYLPLWYSAVLSPSEAYPKAKALLNKALELDETLPQTYTVIGVVQLFRERDWAGAERALQRAIETNPNYSRPYQVRAEMLSLRGKHEAALTEIRHALDIDPLSLPNNGILAFCLYYARQSEKCIEQALKTLELDANFYYGRWALGVAYAQMGDFSNAIAQLLRALELTKGNPMLLGILGAVHAASGDQAAAQQILGQLNEFAGRRYVSPVVYAPIYSQLGNHDAAFEHLEKGFSENSPRLLWLNVEPLFDPLRRDNRFADLVRRFGLAN